MGGNFASATPDTDVTEAALRSCALTVQVSTKLNRSHVVHGAHGADPAVAGPHRPDIQAGGKQLVSVEDSMSMVHLSRGSLHPPSDAAAQRGGDRLPARPRRCSAPDHPVPWEKFNDDYDHDPRRDRRRRARLRRLQHAGSASPTASSCRTRRATRANSPPRTGKANFAVNPLEWVPVPPGRLVLQTLRSHDQYNTTIYGLDDRYRGVKGGRRVVFVNPADIEAFGLSDGARVDLVSEFTDGDGHLQERRAKDFLVVPYSTPVGNAAAYYPETNPLVPLDHTAAKSNTPVSKAIVIRLERDDGSGDRAAPGQPRHRRRRGRRGPRRWSSRSRWRSASTARRSP